MEDLIKKFMDCASKAVKKISDNDLDKVIKCIMALEDLKDIREIMECLRQ